MYKSELDGREVDPAQYLAELMCIRMAKKKGQKLVGKFWLKPEWKMPFKTQKIAAYGLFKLYEPKIIITVLKKCEATYSLRSPWLTEKFIEEKAKVERIEQKATQEKPEMPTIEVKETEIIAPRKTFGKGKNIRNLDG